MAIDLNRKLELQERIKTPDDAGGFATGWATLGTIWGQIKAQAGRALAHDEIAGSVVRYQIIVRAAAPGAPSRPVAGQRVLSGARVFDIKAVREFDLAGHYLSLVAEEEVAR